MHIKPQTVELAAALALIAACADDPVEAPDPSPPDASTSSEAGRDHPDGSVRGSDGSAHASDGSVRASDGSARDSGVRGSDGSAHASDGSARASDSSAHASDGSTPRACALPEDCKDVKTPLFEVAACCSHEVKCGFLPPVGAPDQLAETVTNAVDPEREFEDGCVPRERHFLSFPGLMDERVPVEGGEDILIAEECEQSAFLSVSFAGCCMADGSCGISTYQIHDTLAVLVGPEAKLARLQCVSSETMNAYIAETSLAGFAFLPERRGRCDYAALDARLPPLESPLAIP